MTMREPLGITVIGGHVLARTRTIVGAMLGQTSDRPIAAVVPDIDSLPLDPRRIRSRVPGKVVLDDGSFCVSSASGLLPTLVSLLHSSPQPSRVIVDGGDHASPWEVAGYGRLPGFSLVGVVFVLPVANAVAMLTDKHSGRETCARMSSADTLVLAGAATVLPQELARIRRQVRVLVPGPRIVVDAPAAGSEHLLTPAPRRPVTIDQPSAYSALNRGGRASVAWATSAPVDRKALLRLLSDPGIGIHHVSGVVALRHAPDVRSIIIGRPGSWMLVEGEPWQNSTPATAIVFSGPAHLVARLTQRSLDRLFSHRERGRGPKVHQSLR